MIRLPGLVEGLGSHRPGVVDGRRHRCPAPGPRHLLLPLTTDVVCDARKPAAPPQLLIAPRTAGAVCGVRGGRKFRCAYRFGIRRCTAVRGIEGARGGPFDQQGDEASEAASVEPTERGLDQVLDHLGVEVRVALDQSGSDVVDIVFFAVAHDDYVPPGRAGQEHVSAHDSNLRCSRGQRTDGTRSPRALGFRFG